MQLNTRIFKRWTGLALAGLMTVLGVNGAAHAEDTLTRMLSEKKVKVGYIPYDDLTHRDLSSGEITGFFPELLETMLAEVGIKPENIEYVATDWANFAVGLQAEKYDISIGGTFSTIPRASAASFTRPIFYLGNSAVTLKGDDRFSDVDDVMDLDRSDITIAVVSGEQSYHFVKNNFSNAQVKVVKSADLSTGLLEVTAKRADVAMSDHYVVKSFVAKHPETVDLFADNPWHTQPIAWSVRHQDQALRSFLNTTLDYMESTGRLQAIMEKDDYQNVPFLLKETKLVPVH